MIKPSFTLARQSRSDASLPGHDHHRTGWTTYAIHAGFALMLTGMVCTGSGCTEENSNKTKSNKSVFVSSGKFNQGYQDGKRDAQWALLDANGSWMWLWMTESEYQKGYDQGWRDGRQMAKLQQKQQQRESDQSAQPTKPPPSLESADKAP